MATRRETAPRACRLSQAPMSEVLELLAEERRAWTERLHWDPAELGEALELAACARLLPGTAVLLAGRVEGYISSHASAACFRPCSVHVRPGAPPETAELLVSSLLASPEARGRRIEAQLSAFEAQDALDAAFARRGVEVIPRSWLCLDLTDETAGQPIAATSSGGLRLEPWSASRCEACAPVLVAAHRGSVEARINACFQDTASARGYLMELLRGPGCGHFLPGASFLAMADGEPVGFCLATTVSAGTAHLPQIAVHPRAQGRGVGAALLTATRGALLAEGCRRLTLSVSRANAAALDWYLRLGFRELAGFAAYHRPGPS